MRTIRVIAILIAAIAGAARAQEASPEQKTKAKDLYERAKIHYRSGDLEKAAAEFKESYEAFPRPETLFNLAQTHRLLKNYEKAIFYYKQYLSSANIGERDRKTTEERIADLENLLRQQQAVQSAPPPGPEPPSAKGDTAAPSQNGGAPATNETTIATRPAPRSWVRDPVPWIAFGVGAVGVATGAALLGVAAHEGSLASNATDPNAFALHHSNDLTDQKVGWPLLAVGAAGVVVGGIVIAIDSRKGR